MISSIIIIIVIICILYNKNKRAQKMLMKWSNENKLTLINAERRFILRGPFVIPLQGFFVVYHIEVTDSNSKHKKIWVKLGSIFLGLLSEKVETIVEDEITKK